MAQHGARGARGVQALRVRVRVWVRVRVRVKVRVRVRSNPNPNLNQVREAFKRYDRDKNGKLDGGELRAALQHIGLNPNQKEASELLKSYDGTP